MWTSRSLPASGLTGNGPIGAAPIADSWGVRELVMDGSTGAVGSVRFIVVGPGIDAIPCEHVVVPPGVECNTVTAPRRVLA